jgi:multidrug efflux pump subunit AcrA (membrane-fusion protein)
MSTAIALLCAGWAVYATRHPAGGSGGMGPPGMEGPGMGGSVAGGADLAAANAALVESTARFERGRDLLPTQALSKSQFDQIVAAKTANAARVNAARARLEDTVIRAPFSGRVGLRRVSLGSFISPGTVITTLDDRSVIKVEFAVPCR